MIKIFQSVGFEINDIPTILTQADAQVGLSSNMLIISCNAASAEGFRLARKIRRLVNEAQYELGEIGSIKTHGAAAPKIVPRHVIGPFSRVLSSISSISRCIDTRPSLIMHFCTHSSMGLPARDIRDATKMNLDDRDWAWTAIEARCY